jgi:voltage-gated potassium channel
MSAEISSSGKPRAGPAAGHGAGRPTMDAAERLLVVVGVGAFLLGTLPRLAPAEYAATTGTCLAVAALFAILYGLRLRLQAHPLRQLLSTNAVIDLAAILPLPLALAAGMPAVNARLLGVLWALKLIRLNPAFLLLWRVLRAERQSLLSVAMAALVLVLFAATFAYLFEREGQPQVFDSIPAALWWAVTTITTTGYGDKIPMSFAGRLLGGLVMVAGIGLFALWAGIIASGFANELRRKEFLESWNLVVRLPIFRDLGASALAEISRLLKVQTCPAHMIIVRQGQPADSMYFIADGAAEIHAGKERIRLTAGQFFGEAALITGEPRNATVVAAVPTRLLRLDVLDFRGLAARQPELLRLIEEESAKRRAAAH